MIPKIINSKPIKIFTSWLETEINAYLFNSNSHAEKVFVDISRSKIESL